jgi:class 3 adenylate cyclase
MMGAGVMNQKASVPDPGQSPSVRRLAAVMFLDMVGYSREMARDEKLALRHIGTLEAILRKEISAAGGRLVKLLGDGSLAEFPTAGAAVNCANAVQKAIVASYMTDSPDERFAVRIGINIGEVTEKDGDLHGDSVNIAARIQPLADPGGIAMTDGVYLQVRNQFRLRGTHLGGVRLKNIPERVPVFVTAPNEAAYHRWLMGRHPRVCAAVATCALFVLAATGVLAWRHYFKPEILFEDFEDITDLQPYMGGRATVALSQAPGIKGQSVAITYSGTGGGYWGVWKAAAHLKKGDWSAFGGVRFQMRSAGARPLRVVLAEQGAKPDEEGEWWVTEITPPREWTLVSVPFTSFKKSADWQPPGQDNDNKLSLNRLLAFKIVPADPLAADVFGLDELTLLRIHPPVVPTLVITSPSVRVGASQSFQATARDPDRDQVRYGWDWNGDGEVDEWSTFGPSGWQDDRAHSWLLAGVYPVRAKAQDSTSAESAFSDPFTVTVTGEVYLEDCEDITDVFNYTNGGALLRLERVPGFTGYALRANYEGKKGGVWGFGKTLATSAFPDWTGFGGLKLMARSANGKPVVVALMEEGKAPGSEGEIWVQPLKPETQWKEVNLSFRDFTKLADFQPAGQDANGKLDLDHLRSFIIRDIDTEKDALEVDQIALVAGSDPARGGTGWTVSGAPTQAVLDSFSETFLFRYYKDKKAELDLSMVPGVQGTALRAAFTTRRGLWGIIWNSGLAGSGDWHRSDGIRFMFKGTKGTQVQVRLVESSMKDPTVEGEHWFAAVSAPEQWTEIRVPFNTLVRDKNWQPAGSDDNGKLDLERAFDLRIVGANVDKLIGSRTGVFYIDDLALYGP